MKRDVHEQVREWIASAGAEGLTDAQPSWVQAHVEDCETCRNYAEAASQLIRSLRSVPMAADLSLVRTTQMRVRLRAQQLRQKQERLWLIWASCALVGLTAATTTPLLWRSFQWMGEWARVSSPVWQVGFALFSMAPALAASVLFLARGTYLTNNGRWQG